MDKEPIHPGLVIPQAKSRVPGFKTLRRIISVCNAVLKIRVKVPFVNNLGEISVGDAKVTISKEGGLEVDLSQITAASSGGGGDVSGVIVFKGEWSSSKEGGYNIYSMVIITNGVHQGTYVSLANANASLPYNSSSWVQLPGNNPIGLWS